MEADLSKPASMQGYALTGHVTFAPDGEPASVHSPRDQVVRAVSIKACDHLELDHGKPALMPFDNPCARP